MALQQRGVVLVSEQVFGAVRWTAHIAADGKQGLYLDVVRVRLMLRAVVLKLNAVRGPRRSADASIAVAHVRVFEVRRSDCDEGAVAEVPLRRHHLQHHPALR